MYIFKVLKLIKSLIKLVDLTQLVIQSEASDIDERHCILVVPGRNKLGLPLRKRKMMNR